MASCACAERHLNWETLTQKDGYVNSFYKKRDQMLIPLETLERKDTAFHHHEHRCCNVLILVLTADWSCWKLQLSCSTCLARSSSSVTDG